MIGSELLGDSKVRYFHIAAKGTLPVTVKVLLEGLRPRAQQRRRDPTPTFDELIEVDLGSVHPSVSGPKPTTTFHAGSADRSAFA